MADVMTAVVAATLLASGTATRYDPGVMQVVVANRVIYGQIDPETAHRGYVALLDCEHLGRLVWLQQGERVGGPYMVADCAAERDRRRLLALGFAVDLSWELAQEWGIYNLPGAGFLVWDSEPRLSRRAR